MVNFLFKSYRIFVKYIEIYIVICKNDELSF